MKAVLRNGLPFVPLAGVCRYFELRYSYTPTNYGTLVRITNGQEKMDTALFVQSASNSTAMRSRYYEYLRQLTGGTASPSPSDSSPAPSQTGGGEENQSQHLTVRLAIRYTGEDTQALLELLEEQGISALFLFSPQQLAQAGDSLRQMVGSGHAIGLAVPGNSREEALAALDAGSAQLEGMLLLRTHTAYLENASNAALQAVEAAGWACWQDGLDARPDGGSLSSQRANLLARLEGRRGAVDLLLDDSEDGVSLLRQALPRMEQMGCTFSLAVETRLF